MTLSHATIGLGFGARLDENGTIDTWKQQAGLDWEAQAAPVKFVDGQGNTQHVPNRKVLFRSDTHKPLSIVSNRYQTVQPPQVLEFFNDLVGEFGTFKMHTAGTLLDGKKIWALAKANEQIDINGDVVDRYLLLASSYDMSSPTIVEQMGYRQVCTNGLRILAVEKQLRYKHLTAFNGVKVKERLALDDSWSVFAATAQKMAEKKIKNHAEERRQRFFSDALWGSQADKLSEKVRTKKLEELEEVYSTAPGQQLDTARGTVWGWLNAITYYVDHQAGAKTEENRLDKAWFGEGQVIKNRAYNAALQLVN